MSDNDKLARVRVLLDHWIDHNREHGQEFREWAERVRQLGEVGAADEMIRAAQGMEEAGECLSRALERLGGREE